MKIVCFEKTAPTPKLKDKIRSIFKINAESSTNKVQIIKNFHTGIIANGELSILQKNFVASRCDVAVIQGWSYDSDISSPHLKLRRSVINQQRDLRKYTITADASLFQYRQKITNNNYLRYSINGIFKDTGIYGDDNPQAVRWEKISRDYDIKLLPYKSVGKKILLLLQRNGGWAMKGLATKDWMLDTIEKIRQYSDRPILIRPHPGDRSAADYLKLHLAQLEAYGSIEISIKRKSLEEELDDCWAVINHNSSAVVGPIIMGYHAFVTDVQASQSAEVANLLLSEIEYPKQFDRLSWLKRVSMSHWNFEEVIEGHCWRHMRQYINNGIGEL